MLSGVGEYIFGGAILLIGLVIWLAKEYGASQQFTEDLEDDIEGLKEASRNDKKAKDNEAAIRNDYATGKPRRMQGKYDID